MQNKSSDQYRLVVLRPEQVEASWSVVGALLERSIEFCNGEFEAADILDMVKSGRAFILGLYRDEDLVLCAACEVLVLPRRRLMNFIAIGGEDMRALFVDQWGRIESIAKTLEVDAIRGAVRPSMQRYCKRIDPASVVAYTVLEKRL